MSQSIHEYITIVMKKILFFLFIFLAFFSFYKLSESPSVWYDEGLYSQMAGNLAEFGRVGVQMAPNNIVHFSKFTVGYPLIYPLALFYKIFGFNIYTGRTVMILFIFALVITSYFFLRKIHNEKIALFSLSLLVTFPTLYGNGKSVLGEVPGLFFLLFSLLAFSIALSLGSNSENKKKIIWLVLSGLSAGLCIATKPIFLVFLVSIIIVLSLALFQKEIKAKEVLIFAISVLIPFILWILLQFEKDITFAQIITFYINPNHVSDMSSLIINNIKSFFTNAGPIYLLLTMIVWTIAIVYRIYWKQRKVVLQNVSYPEMIAFIFCLLIVLAYLRISGQFRYLFPAQILALLFLSNSLFAIEPIFEKIKILNKYTNMIFVYAICFLCLFGTYGLLFNSWVANYYSSHKTAFWIDYFAKAKENESTFFYNTPEVTVFSNNRNYYQYLEPAVNMKVGIENINQIEKAVADKIIIPSNYYRENMALFERYTLEKNIYKYSILRRTAILI